MNPENMVATAETAREASDRLPYLVAAYTAVWIILAIYLLVLWLRNRKLRETIAQLETRVGKLDGQKSIHEERFEAGNNQ